MAFKIFPPSRAPGSARPAPATDTRAAATPPVIGPSMGDPGTHKRKPSSTRPPDDVEVSRRTETSRVDIGRGLQRIEGNSKSSNSAYIVIAPKEEAPAKATTSAKRMTKVESTEESRKRVVDDLGTEREEIRGHGHGAVKYIVRSPVTDPVVVQHVGVLESGADVDVDDDHAEATNTPNVPDDETETLYGRWTDDEDADESADDVDDTTTRNRTR